MTRSRSSITCASASRRASTGRRVKRSGSIPVCRLRRRSPLRFGHHHIELPAAAARTEQPLAPVKHRGVGAVPNSHLRRGGFPGQCPLMLQKFAFRYFGPAPRARSGMVHTETSPLSLRVVRIAQACFSGLLKDTRPASQPRAASITVTLARFAPLTIPPRIWTPVPT